MARILIFGDSIAQGAWDERGGWADRLKGYYNSAKLDDLSVRSVGVFNLGISGNTADDVVVRIEGEIVTRQDKWATRNDLYIIAVGVNDSRSSGGQENLVSSPEHYQEQLERIIEVVHKFSDNILFIGITPVDDSKTLACGDTQYWLARVAQFNQVLVDFCDKHTLPIVEIFDSMQQMDFKGLLPDGLHPNTEGHEWMYEQIKPHVLRLLEEK
jgi:lysophospholipase L1-like esterase